jgi:hypothetical protein
MARSSQTTFGIPEDSTSNKPTLTKPLDREMKAKRQSPIALYRQLIKRHQYIEKEMDKLMKEKTKNGLKILKLVLTHDEVKNLHHSSYGLPGSARSLHVVSIPGSSRA